MQISTTSPAVARPFCHSDSAQISSAIVITHHRQRMGDAQLLEVAQAAAARRRLAGDGRVEARTLEADAAEGAGQAHVGDDVDHLAVNPRGAIGECADAGAAR